MPPNILLVILDSVRSKNTSVYGYDRDTTPFLSNLSDDSVLFTQARSPSVASLPSHISLFTGYHTIEHNFNNDEHTEYELASGNTIWEELSENYNYITGVFSENPYLTRLPIGIRSSFDVVVDQEEPPFPNSIDPREYHNQGTTNYINWFIDCVQSGSTLRSLLNGMSMKLGTSSKFPLPKRLRSNDFIDIFLKWIDSLDDSKPWAACINLMDTHKPYDPDWRYDKWGSKEAQAIQDSLDHSRWDFVGGKRPIDELSQLRDLYDGTILQADQKIKKLIAGLQQNDDYENTFIVITSDHGEGFGEKSPVRPDQYAIGHTVGIHESQLHVPLIVKPTTDSRRTEDKLATLTRFPSVVRAVLNNSQHPENEFLSENPIATQLTVGENTISNAKKHNISLGDIQGELNSVYEQIGGDLHKHIQWDDKYITYSLDGGRNIVEDIDTEKRLERLLESTSKTSIKNRCNSKIDESTRERLSDLGYV